MPIDWRRDREQLRRAFGYRCGYCEITEQGYTARFAIDHFRPSAIFPHEASSRANLVYVCHECNVMKSTRWPKDQENNPVLHPLIDDYSMHISIDRRGVYMPKTASGG